MDTTATKIIELMDKTHYHMFDKNTGVNYHRTSSVANLHNQLLSYSPEQKEELDENGEPIPKTNLMMGCYLLHLKDRPLYLIFLYHLL